MTGLTWFEKIFNYMGSPKVKGHCRLCNRPIFNLNSKFGKKELCIYCYTAYEEGQGECLTQVLNPKDNQWSLIDRSTGNIIARSETGFKGVTEYAGGVEK